jgi:DNA-binding transcriptional MerR regulator
VTTRRDDAEKRASIAVETASRELSLVVDELHRLSEAIRPRNKGQAQHLDGIAYRLESMAGVLGREVMLGLDPWILRGTAAMARRLLGRAAAAALFVAGGMLEGVGAEIYSNLREGSPAAIDALDRVEAAAGALPDDLPGLDSGVESPTLERDVTDFDGLPGFSGREAADIVGITYRQLDYWVRTDLVRSSLADSKGSGSRRRYSHRDLVEHKMIKTLLDGGQRLDRVRAAFGYLRELGDDLASAQLVIAGESVIVVRDGVELVDVLDRYQGEGVVNVLDLNGVVHQVDKAILDLRPSDHDEGSAS